MATFSILLVTLAAALVTAEAKATATCGVPAISPVFNDTLQSRVRGGEEAKPGSWPWQVRVGVKTLLGSGFMCGGTIIDERHILTAAHCFMGPKPPLFLRYFIRVGDHNAAVTEVAQRDYDVAQVVEHPDWSMPDSGPKNDIAILKLKSPIVFSNTVSPVCLSEEDGDAVGDRVCVVTGWGSTVNQVTGQRSELQSSFFAPAMPIMKPSNVLKQAVLPILERSFCRQIWGFVEITDYMICTAAENLDREPCQGDSGGPLVCEGTNPGEYIQEGVVSFGAGCGLNGPAVFTRVGKFRNWLRSVTDAVSTSTIIHN